MEVNENSIYKSVKNALSWYIDKIQENHPKLPCQIMTCLLSGPKAIAQMLLHVDYKPETWINPPDEQPVSAILAIEAFSLDIVKQENKKKLETVIGPPGKMIIFSNKCVH